ncbi:MAG: LysR family transcriptional regulator [Proteobacteria bacterium]|nr:LysR family transcriptional regulator [Pseudomonadota bacterium]
MDIKHLRQIAEIRRAGSFSAAARRLKISQPSLSKSISKLEAEMNVKLFERAGGAARPTDYGVFVAEQAENVLNIMAAVTQDLELLTRGEAGQLRIGVGGATRVHPLPEILDRIIEKYPRLRVETRNESAPLLVRSLRTGRYDLLFCTAEIADSAGDLIRIRLFDDPHAFVVHATHPLAAKPPKKPEQLLQYPLATFGVFPSLRTWAGDISAEAERNLFALATGEAEIITRQVGRGRFVAYGPHFIFKRQLNDGTFVELPFPALPKFECWMLTTGVRWRSPFIRDIAAVAKSVTAQSRTLAPAVAKEPRRQPVRTRGKRKVRT